MLMQTNFSLFANSSLLVSMIAFCQLGCWSSPRPIPPLQGLFREITIQHLATFVPNVASFF
jgi:hypothetical protein